MNFSFKVESFRQKDCIIRVCYSSDGVSDRRANVAVPAQVLKRQDPDEIRTYIIQKAPVREWKDELSLQLDTLSSDLAVMINRNEPFVVLSDEYDSVMAPSAVVTTSETSVSPFTSVITI